MQGRMIWNDIKQNKLWSVSTWLFMSATALMFALTCFLYVGLIGSIDVLMEKAQTPDFLQMHAGELSEQELTEFADREEVREYQTLKFLNLENGSLSLDGRTLINSTQDNGVCVQSEKFDFLLDMDNRIVIPSEGEVYVPVCYRREYQLKVGQYMQLGDIQLVIAGFLRDSQMNSMMASSKRFLVNPADYERLKSMGTEEYLIEFLLREGTDVNTFATEYADSGLPANGPTITGPLIRMMNALSDGLMILVILLVSVLLLLIAMLCIWYTLLNKLEAEQREVSMLRAIGIDRRRIRRMYLLKFLILSAAGALTGLLFAYLLQKPLSAQLRELYGPSENGMWGLLPAVLGAVMTEAVLLLMINHTLKKRERRSAAPRALIVIVVIAACVFMMSVPHSLQSTIASPQFVTYMGIGDGEIRLDIRQTENILGDTDRVAELLSRDNQISRYTVLLTGSYRILLPDGSVAKLNVETGDHSVFPVTYAEGEAPVEENELALSWLCAREFGLTVGDEVELLVGEDRQRYRISGIYSDITNGGKTAKAAVVANAAEQQDSVAWSICYITLDEWVDADEWLSELQSRLAEAGINAKAVDIREYVLGTYGQTMRQIQLASRVAVGIAFGVMLLVVMLFVRLLVTKERFSVSLRKALGFTGREIKAIYYRRLLGVALLGVLLGILSGNLLGERLSGLLLQSMGAAGFRFIIDLRTIYIAIPVFALLTALLAVMLGLRAVKDVRPFECCTGKE